MCGRPGEAAPAGGTLAVRDCPQCLFPRNKYPIWPSSSSNDVHTSQHTSDTPKLPGRPDHVLPAQGVRELQQWQPHGGVGSHLAPASRRLGSITQCAQRAAALAGTLDSRAASHTALPRLANGRQPPHERRAKGERSNGGGEMNRHAPLSPPPLSAKATARRGGGDFFFFFPPHPLQNNNKKNVARRTDARGKMQTKKNFG